MNERWSSEFDTWEIPVVHGRRRRRRRRGCRHETLAWALFAVIVFLLIAGTVALVIILK